MSLIKFLSLKLVFRWHAANVQIYPQDKLRWDNNARLIAGDRELANSEQFFQMYAKKIPAGRWDDYGAKAMAGAIKENDARRRELVQRMVAA